MSHTTPTRDPSLAQRDAAHTRRATATRRLLLAGVAIAAVAALTLAPRWIVAPARGAIMQLVDVFAMPLVGGIPYGDVEAILNAVMFVPLGATVALLLSRRAWPAALFAGAAISTAVEIAQSSIPGRVPDPADILWNTMGGALGVLVVTACRLLAGMARSGQPTADRAGRVTRT